MHITRIGSALFLSSLLLLGGCSGFKSRPKAVENINLTPVTSGPTSQFHPGKFVWHDLLTPDAAAARSFYKQLFGWTVEVKGGYTVLSNKGHLVGGIVEVKATDGRGEEGVWLASVSVPDVDAASKVAKKNGAKILKGPVDMELRGRGVLINDPLGANIILLKAANGDPVDGDPEMGDWLWNELWSDKPEDSLQFYQRVTGYSDVIAHDGYDILLNEGKWRAGIRHVSGKQDLDGTAFKVRWVPVVRVADPEAIASRAIKLGGMVWVKPGEGPSNGDSALLSDTTGGLFMIQRWPSQVDKVGE